MPDPTELSWQFDDAAELYDEVRPGYPDETIEHIVRFAALSPESRIFEVGCGTGVRDRRPARAEAPGGAVEWR